MFTLSQTGLEKAVGEGCLVINSPLCTGRILLLASFFVLVTDLGTTGLEQHALIEKVICMLMYLQVVFAHLRQLFLNPEPEASSQNRNVPTSNLAEQLCLLVNKTK